MACNRKCNAWFMRGEPACANCPGVPDGDEDENEEAEEAEDVEETEDDEDDDDEDDDGFALSGERRAAGDHEPLSDWGVEIRDAFEEGKRAFEVIVNRTMAFQTAVKVIANSEDEAIEIAKKGIANIEDPEDLFEGVDKDIPTTDELQVQEARAAIDDFPDFMDSMYKDNVLINENGSLDRYEDLVD